MLCAILPAAAIWPLVILGSRLSRSRCCINPPTLWNIDKYIIPPSQKKEAHVAPRETPLATLPAIFPAVLKPLGSRLSRSRCCINPPTLWNIDEHIIFPSQKKGSSRRAKGNPASDFASDSSDAFKFGFTCPKMIIWRQLEISLHVLENLLKRVGVHSQGCRKYRNGDGRSDN